MNKQQKQDRKKRKAKERNRRVKPHTRRCGECRACCYPMFILEIKKPADQWCPHCTSTGCAIYADRPDACRDFACMWLRGRLPEWYRPDKCGLIFKWEDGYPVVTVVEFIVGATAKQYNRDLIRRIIRAGYIFANDGKYQVNSNIWTREEATEAIREYFGEWRPEEYDEWEIEQALLSYVEAHKNPRQSH